MAAALKLYRTGKFAEAIAAYNAIIPAGGTDAAAAYAGLTRVYLKQKNVPAAYDAAQKAVALTPDRAPAIVALGEVYFRQGKIPEAEGDFLKPLLACNLDARAFLGLNLIHQASLNFKHAKSEIDQAYKLDPADPDIRREYLDTLRGPARIQALEAYLAGDNNDDDETLASLRSELKLLESEASEPQKRCRLTSNITSTETTLERLLEDPTHIRAYGLRVKVNGVSSLLMVDTGASGIVIDKKIAEKAGIKPVVQTTISGFGDQGEGSSSLGYADKIQIGNLEFENCFVEVTSGRSVLGDDGLIGANVFRHFLVDMDMPDEKLKLSPLPAIPDEPAAAASSDAKSEGQVHFHDRYVPPEMKDFSKVYLVREHLLIPTSVNDSASKLFMIDTGSWDNTLSLATALEVTRINHEPDVHVHGLSGSVKNVYSASKAKIRFSHFYQERQDLVAFDLTSTSNAFGTEISGVLGFAMLRMLDMKIDYRDGLVDFKYDEKRYH
jgi:predicted aspartyl protease